MARGCKCKLVCRNPAAVVGDTNPLGTTICEQYVNAFGFRVDCIFDQFFDNTRGPFYHLASSDFVYDIRRQLFDLRHQRIRIALWGSGLHAVTYGFVKNDA